MVTLGQGRGSRPRHPRDPPDTGERFPGELWDVRVGASYRHKFENDWIGAANLTIGSLSDKPFASEDEMILRAIGFLRVPHRDRNAWLFSLIYASDQEFLGGVPFVPVGNGFGNVFTRVFGHPDRAEAVVELLEHGEVRKVDVGIANDEIFLSHRSYGFLEQIQQAAERGRKQPRNRLLRYVWYYGVAMHFLLRTRLASIRVEIDDRLVAEDAVLVSVANVETYRGWLSLTPAASPIDGMFDVFLVPRVSKVGLVWRLLKLMFRLSGCWRGVALYRGRRVVVTTPTRQEKLRTQRRALPLLLPPGAIESLRQRTVDESPPAATVS